MKRVVKAVAAALFLSTASAHAWTLDTVITPNPKIGTMFTWWAGPLQDTRSLSLNCLSTGGAWITLIADDTRYQAPALDNVPAITKIDVADADGVTHFETSRLNFWRPGREGDLAGLVYSLKKAITIVVTTDDGHYYRIRPGNSDGLTQTDVCTGGYPAMVNPKTNTTYTPDELENLP